MLITGKFLKENRESQQLSISEVAMATKISSAMLKAIEEGQLEKLPAKTFLRGFVQAYASYLKLDVDEVMNMFFEEMGSTTPEIEIEEKPAPVSHDRTLTSMRDSSTMVKVVALSAIVFLIFVIVAVKGLVEKYEKESLVEPPPPSLESLSQQSAESKPDSLDQQNSTPKPESVPAVVAESSPPSNSGPEPQPAPAAELKAEENVKQEAPVASESPEESGQSTSPAEEVSPPPPAVTTKEVIIEALDRVEIAIEVNNEPMKKIVLNPDEVHTIKGSGRVTLDLSDGGAVNLIVNGKDRGVPGDLGKAKKVQLP